MKNRFSFAGIFRYSALALCIGVLLPACDNASKSQTSTPAAAVKSTSAVTLEGQIRDDEGFFQSGKLQASDFSGKKVAETEWRDDTGRYSIEIPAGTGFPVVLTAKTQHEGSKSTTLVAAVVSPTLSKHDITPNSTQVAKKAKELGGYTTQNMMQATLDTVNRPQGDRSVGGFRGDPTKQFGGWH
ncbi:MAG: hypothetical protein ACU843_11325 [Gammaproteobacteria bacterium]